LETNGDIWRKNGDEIMKINGNTIVITGGATGIGFALAKEFVKAGNEVIICGRRELYLKEAKKKLPQLHIKVCDVSKEQQRRELIRWVSSTFKDVNVLVNNAGIQRIIDFRTGKSNRSTDEDEIDINLKAPVHLSELCIPLFIERKESAIINVTSGLGFCPIAAMPVYCATKAALHSFTVSLRHQLRNTSIKVFEIIPPTVDTDLDKGARDQRGQKDKGIAPSEVAVATLHALEKDEYEKAVGMAEGIRTGVRNNPEQIFQRMNQW
jgi:uncharacterized oxidoreductase